MSAVIASPDSVLWVSPSQLLTYDTCPRQWHLERQWRSRLLSGAMAFGDACDTGIMEWLAAVFAGNRDSVDPVAVFEAKFAALVGGNSMEYPSGWEPEDFVATGRVLMQRFIEAWDASGYEVVGDKDGKPMLQRMLAIGYPGNIRSRTKLDVFVRTPEGKHALIDVKATAGESCETFIQNASQLMDYQAVLTAWAPVLGTPVPDLIGYWELLRKKVPKRSGEGPVVPPPKLIPAHPVEVLEERTQAIVQSGAMMRAGVIPRRAGLSFSTPCAYCRVSSACLGAPDTTLLTPRTPRGKAGTP